MSHACPCVDYLFPDSPFVSFPNRLPEWKSNTPQQATEYLTLAAVAKWTYKHVRLARCPRE